MNWARNVIDGIAAGHVQYTKHEYQRPILGLRALQGTMLTCIAVVTHQSCLNTYPNMFTLKMCECDPWRQPNEARCVRRRQWLCSGLCRPAD